MKTEDLNLQNYFRSVLGKSGNLKISKHKKKADQEVPAQILTRAQEAALAYGLGPEPLLKEPDTQTVLVENIQMVDAVFAEVRRTGILCIDVETTGLDPLVDEVVSYQISPRVGISYYFPLRHKGYDKNLPVDYCMRMVGETFTDAKIAKIAHNFKFDYRFWLKLGYRDIVNAHDTYIQSHLLNEGKPWGHGLKEIVLHELKYKMIKFEELGIHTRGKFKEGMLKDFSELPVQNGMIYACADTDYTLRLHEMYYPQIEKEEFRFLYLYVEMPLVFTLARMEARGMNIDEEYIRSFHKPFEEDIAQLELKAQELAALAGFSNEPDKKGFREPFNPASSQQVGELTKLLGLTTGKYTATGRMSVDSKGRDKLKDKHPIYTILGELAEKQKLLNTYLLPLVGENLHPITKKVHTNFNQGNTDTGRLSSSNPNVQNIPKVKGVFIRKGFIPDGPDYRFIRADFSQAELRLVAHVSKCQPLIEAFKRGDDIHSAVAIKAFHLEEKYPGITAATLKNYPDGKLYRDRAKAVSFGLLYGTTAWGLSKNLKCSAEEAQGMIDDFYLEFPELRDWIDRTLKFCEKKGYVETPLKRRRRFVRDETGQYRIGWARAAQNMPIQGASADLTKWSMVQLDEKLKSYDAALVCQVHDEILICCRQDQVDMVIPIVKNTMESGFKHFSIELLVKPLVELDVQSRWSVDVTKCPGCARWSVEEHVEKKQTETGIEEITSEKCLDCTYQEVKVSEQ